MNLNLLSKLLIAISKRILAKETPYALDMAKALTDFGVTCAEILITPTPADQKKELWIDAISVLKSVLTSLEEQGAEILNDIPELIAQASSDTAMSLFGFDQTAQQTNIPQ